MTMTPMIARSLASPLMTPITQQLYAFGETPSSELSKIGSIFNKARAQQNTQHEAQSALSNATPANLKNQLI